MNIRLVVFDIAGTTVRDQNHVADVFQAAFKREGLPVTAEKVNEVMGFRKDEAIRYLLTEAYPQLLSEVLVDRIHASFIEQMIAFYEKSDEIEALPFAEDVFRALHRAGIKTALNTGFSRNITEVILRKLSWKDSGLIDVSVCSDEVEAGRPAPFMIQLIMQQLDIKDPAAVMKVGDTEVDVKEGRNAGCGMVVGVTTGSYTREELEKYAPDHIIDHLSELIPLLV
jgi:phosphonatase-like hydrolase